MKTEKLNHKNRCVLGTLLLLCCCFFSCEKNFLNEKPNSILILPKSLAEYQGLLDNPQYMVLGVAPALSQGASDDFMISDAGLKNLPDYDRDAYSWAKELVMFSAEWQKPYTQVFYCNVVLEGLEDIHPEPSAQAQYNAIKGMAYFLRAQAFFNLAQTFASVYDPAYATQAAGIPLVNSSDVNKRFDRATLQQTYEQITGDFNRALLLLPDISAHLTRPTKTAAIAYLARVYLSMGDYNKAGLYADEALKIKNTLIDYNTLNLASARTFPLALSLGNPEMIYYSTLFANSFNLSSLVGVETSFYDSYDINDLRKAVFFINRGTGVLNFRGSYSGDAYLFCGLATDELFLIRAESKARSGDKEDALLDLNTLLAKRYKTGTFSPFTTASAEQALRLILSERRKELTGRGLRWSDLRRLNREPSYAVTLRRVVNGSEITLPPNDPRYVFPITLEELAYHNIPQNPR